MKYERGEFEVNEPIHHPYRALVVVLACVIVAALAVMAMFFRKSGSGTGDGFEWGELGNLKNPADKPSVILVTDLEKIPGKMSEGPALTPTQLDAIPGPHK